MWCNWLIVFMYVVNSDADPIQMTKILSMNLFRFISGSPNLLFLVILLG